MCSDANDSLWARHLLRNGTTAKKNKPAAQNPYVQSLQDTQPRKKQKLDGGRLRQVRFLQQFLFNHFERKPGFSCDFRGQFCRSLVLRRWS
jgi:hypothetical protein